MQVIAKVPTGLLCDQQQWDRSPNAVMNGKEEGSTIPVKMALNFGQLQVFLLPASFPSVCSFLQQQRPWRIFHERDPARKQRDRASWVRGSLEQQTWEGNV